jgi:site-specific DNA-cytosine methylase
MTTEYKALDLLGGIGSMTVALIDTGFDVIGVIDDKIDIELYKSISGNSTYIHTDNQVINPDDLPDVDVIVGRFIPQELSIARNKRFKPDINYYIINILLVKSPKVFLLESSTLFVNKFHGRELQELLYRISDFGYKIFYEVLEEKYYSGLPTSGKRLYFVGIRQDINKEEFYFPEKIYSNFEINYEEMNLNNIDDWYRKVPKFDYFDIQPGKLYKRNKYEIRETNQIYYSGFYNETYYSDSKGLRRLTHDELAKMKGFKLPENCNYKNKRSLYYKINNSSNVYVTRAILSNIVEYLDNFDIMKNKKVEISPKSKKEVIKEARKDPNKIGLLPKHRITTVHIEELKGLKNLDIDFHKNLVAIMGVNGCGKSTILHALACIYSPYHHGEDYRFSFFFTPNPDSSWKNSKLSITYFDENLQKEISREYKKDYDRWSPRYENRPKRDMFFLAKAILVGMFMTTSSRSILS